MTAFQDHHFPSEIVALIGLKWSVVHEDPGPSSATCFILSQMNLKSLTSFAYKRAMQSYLMKWKNSQLKFMNVVWVLMKVVVIFKSPWYQTISKSDSILMKKSRTGPWISTIEVKHRRSRGRQWFAVLKGQRISARARKSLPCRSNKFLMVNKKGKGWEILDMAELLVQRRTRPGRAVNREEMLSSILVTKMQIWVK